MTNAITLAATGAIALALASPGGAQSNAPAFSPGDQLAAAQSLCGKVSRGSAKDAISGPPEKINGFLAEDGGSLCVELLSVALDHKGAAKRLVVFGEHRVEDGEIDSSQAAQTDVHAGVLEWRNGKWTMTIRAPSLAETGFNGRDPAVALRRLDDLHAALEIAQNYWNRGSGMSTVSLYEPSGAAFKEVITVVTDADDCGWKDPCFRFEGALAYGAGAAGSGDIALTLKGAFRDSAGRVVPIPPGPIVLRRTPAGYAPVLATPSARAMWAAVKSPWN